MSSPSQAYSQFRKRQAEEKTVLAAFRDNLAFPLDQFQVDACKALERGESVLVAAPTGAGKTVVGEFAAQLALRGGERLFYTTPIKALSNQKYRDFVADLGSERVGLLTGDASINSGAEVVVMTTEVLRNMIYSGSPALDRLGYVVMDEVHYLQDAFRGPVWEEIIIQLPARVQLVALSATVSNAEEFGQWLETVRGAMTVVVSEDRPVPLWQHVLTRHGLVNLYAAGKGNQLNPELLARRRRRRPGPQDARQRRRHFPPRFAVVEAVRQAGLLPAIFFVFSRAGCDAAVDQCLDAGLSLTDSVEAEQIDVIVEQACASIPPADLRAVGYGKFRLAARAGIAAHHAGMLPVFKQIVEELFQRNLLKVIFATETLALGINMPAKSVILDRLVKWNGSAHVALTPGEYTQLTGRAGRRGIDVEGHAVVVDQPDMDLEQVAALASKRTYPLRSAFRPTYNMAANLLDRLDADQAREVLQMSFAQFQADRAVVGLARELRSLDETVDGYRDAVVCSRGDFVQYQGLRDRISFLEKESSRMAAQQRQQSRVQAAAALKVGDVVRLRKGPGGGWAVVTRLQPSTRGPQAAQSDEAPPPPRITVLDTAAKSRVLSHAEALSGLGVWGFLSVPKSFSPKDTGQRRVLGNRLKELGDSRTLTAPQVPERAETARPRAELERLRAELKAHPCHQCPDREQHARWARRLSKAVFRRDRISARMEKRTGSLGAQFDQICTVLAELGYIEVEGERYTLTDAGRMLRAIYAEKDILVAEAVRGGIWRALKPAELAGVVSAVVFSPRIEQIGVPGQGRGAVAQALRSMAESSEHLHRVELSHGMRPTDGLDFGAVASVTRWAQGAHLADVLRQEEMAAGDFVRLARQVIDVLEQLSDDSVSLVLAPVARSAVGAVRRGVVEISGI